MSYIIDSSHSNYKSGTVGSISGTTFTAASGSTAFTSSDVGRLIYINDSSSDAHKAFRRIVEFTSATVVEVDDPWGYSVLRGEVNSNGDRFSESAPVADDTYILSLSWDDVFEANEPADYDNTATYSKGDIVKHTDGNFYEWGNATASTAGEAPTGFSWNQIHRVPTQGDEMFRTSATDVTLYEFDNQQNRIDFNDVVIYDEGNTFRFGLKTMRLRLASALIFGRTRIGDTDNADINGYFENGSNIFILNDGLFVSTQLNQSIVSPLTSISGVQQGDFGDLHFYNCNIAMDDTVLGSDLGGSNSARMFWRLYPGSTSSSISTEADDSIYRFIQCQMYGSFGMRISGTRSAVLDTNWRGGGSTLGKFNAVSSSGSYFGLIKNVRYDDTAQGVYHYWELARSGTIEGVSFNDLVNSGSSSTTYACFINVAGSGTNHQNAYELTWKNVNYNDFVNTDATAFFRHQQNSNAPSDAQRNRTSVKNDFTVSLQDSSLNAITNSAKLAIEDSQGTQFTPTTTSDGSFDTQLLTVETIIFENGGSTDGNSNWGDQEGDLSTVYYPYKYTALVRNYLPGYSSTNLNTQESPAVTLFLDELIDNTDSAAVDLYTDLGTPQRIYDYQWKEIFDDPYIVAVDESFFTRADNTVTTTDSDWNVVFDSSATDVWNWDSSTETLTIKTPAAGYVGGISSASGDVTVDTEIQGDITATNILHSFSDGDTIISAGAMNGTLTLDAGTYHITGGDLSDIQINRTSGDTGTVTITVTNDVDGVDDDRLGTGVEFENTLSIEAGSVTAGRLDIFDGDNLTPVFTDTDFNADTELSSTDVSYLNTGNVLTAVWSGPGRTDYREEITIAVGSNTLTVTNDNLSYPDASTDFTPYNSTESTYIASQLTGATTAAFSSSGTNTSLTVDGLQVDGTDASASNTFELAVNDFLYLTNGTLQVTTAQTINSTSATIVGTLALSDADTPVADNEAFESFPAGLQVAIEIAAGESLELADGTTNEFIQDSGNVRGSLGYNQLLLSDTDAVNAIGSTGATGSATADQQYITFTPRNNKSYTIGFVSQTGESGSISLDRAILATISGTDEVVIFSMNIPSSAAEFDVGTTQVALGQEVETILDERGVITQNMQNIAVNEAVFVDSNGTKQFAPDYS